MGFELLVLALVASIEPIEWITHDRVKVAAIVKGANSPRSHAEAQFRLMRLAKKACKGKGVPRSEGTLTVETVTSEGSRKSSLVISEIYQCVPKPPKG